MDSQIKKAIAAAGAIFIALIGYYGSYLPMRKSMIFIDTMQQSGKIRTVDDFKNVFSVPLDYPSPIGQKEIVRNVANTIANSLQSVSDPGAIDEMVKYATEYYDPIISRGRGMSFGQDVYIMGMMNEIAFVKTSNPKYLQAAEKYFKQAQILGPKRPQGLYGLLDIYRFEGKMDEFKKIADQVLSQWPTDAKVANIVNQALKNATGSKQVK